MCSKQFNYVLKRKWVTNPSGSTIIASSSFECSFLFACLSCWLPQGMYTLMARCEELDRSMQPIHTLAAQIRDIKRTLDSLEAICK